MQTTSLRPGSRVADRRLVALLGDGGEGEVWAAVDPDGRSCALKLLRPAVLPPGSDVRRRGSWLVRIDHPALVRVTRGGRFTAGPLVGWGFVEMELVEGDALQEAPPTPDALDHLAPVAEALDLLHEGVWSDGVPLVHRDVKPGNLIATEDGLVLVDPSTMRGMDTTGDLTRVGTPAYLAPEVLSGRFGPPADVYSLAATAAALLTGARGEGLGAVLRDPRRHGMPDGVVAGLDPDPSRRPGRCADVVDPSWHPPPGWSRPAGRDEVPLHGPDEGEGGTGGRPRGWPLPLLAGVLGVPAAAWALAAPGRAGAAATALGAALVVHLLVHVMTGRPGLALLGPPWAWGGLIAERRHRPTWLADVASGALVAVVAAAVWAVVTDRERWVPLAVAICGLLLVAAAVRQSRTRGRVRWAVVWVLWLPLRVVGAIPRLLGGGRRGDLP